MRIPCPACNKESENETTCRRCGAELAALYAIKENAFHHIFTGRQWFLQDRADKALAFAQTSWALRHSPGAARLAFLACLLLKRFDEATLWYRRGIPDSRNELRQHR